MNNEEGLMNNHCGELRIRSIARAQFFGSRIVKTGVCDGIRSVEWISTIYSSKFLRGGQAIVMFFEFPATNPERAFDLPAIVTKITFGLVLCFSRMANPFFASLGAEAAINSTEYPFSVNGFFISSAKGKSFSEPQMITTLVMKCMGNQ
ncbi:hypothetical protein K9L27_02785 [Candidatus Gracilibacteria bacterium]|nr:hypothetical protein [Candidatus Gracilibacteria bacterium]